MAVLTAQPADPLSHLGCTRWHALKSTFPCGMRPLENEPFFNPFERGYGLSKILTSIKCGPVMAQTFKICKSGRELLKTRKVTSPTRCKRSERGNESFFCFQARLGHHNLLTPFFEVLLRYSWSREARQRLFKNCKSAGKLSRSAASQNKLSAWCDNAHRTLAVSV